MNRITIVKPQPIHTAGVSLHPYEVVIIDGGRRTSILCVAKSGLAANQMVTAMFDGHARPMRLPELGAA